MTQRCTDREMILSSVVLVVDLIIARALDTVMDLEVMVMDMAIMAELVCVGILAVVQDTGAVLAMVIPTKKDTEAAETSMGVKTICEETILALWMAPALVALLKVLEETLKPQLSNAVDVRSST